MNSIFFSTLFTSFFSVASAQLEQTAPSHGQSLKPIKLKNATAVLLSRAHHCAEHPQITPLTASIARSIIQELDASQFTDNELIPAQKIREKICTRYFGKIWPKAHQLESQMRNGQLTFAQNGGQQYPFFLKVRQKDVKKIVTPKEMAEQWKFYVTSCFADSEKTIFQLSQCVPIPQENIKNLMAIIQVIVASAHSDEHEIKHRGITLLKSLSDLSEIKQFRPDYHFTFCQKYGLIDEQKT